MTEGTTRSTHGGAVVLRDAFSYPLSVYSDYTLYEMQFGMSSALLYCGSLLTTSEAHMDPPSTRHTPVYFKHPLSLAAVEPPCPSSTPKAWLVWTTGRAFVMLSTAQEQRTNSSRSSRRQGRRTTGPLPRRTMPGPGTPCGDRCATKRLRYRRNKSNQEGDLVSAENLVQSWGEEFGEGRLQARRGGL